VNNYTLSTHFELKHKCTTESNVNINDHVRPKSLLRKESEPRTSENCKQRFSFTAQIWVSTTFTI